MKPEKKIKYNLEKKPKKKIAIFIPLALPFGMVPQEFFLSLDRTKEYCLQHLDELDFEPQIEIFAPHTFPVDANRNHCVAIAISREFDTTVWFDADHELKEDTLFRLLNNDYPIYAGVYYLKAEPFHPIVFKALEKGFHTFMPLWRTPEEELYFADMIGMGCVKIDVDVFKSVKRPYFKYGKIPESVAQTDKDMRFKKDWDVDDVSEDVHFWRLVKKTKYKIVVDPKIQVGHIRKHVVTSEFALTKARVNKLVTEKQMGEKFPEFWEKNTAQAIPVDASKNGEMKWAL